MPQQVLHRTEAVARLQKVHRERVAQRVRRRQLADSRSFDGPLKGPVEGLVVEVMASHDPSGCNCTPHWPTLLASVDLLSLQVCLHPRRSWSN